MKIKPIKAYAIVKKNKPTLNANAIFHSADKEFIIISSNEKLVQVTITPNEQH